MKSAEARRQLLQGRTFTHLTTKCWTRALGPWVPCSLVSRAEMFGWILLGRRSRSAWWDVGGAHDVALRIAANLRPSG